MGKIHYREIQRFSSPWVWILVITVLAASLAPTLTGLYRLVVLNKPFGRDPLSGNALLLIIAVQLVLYVLIVVLLKKMKLITEVKDDGFYYRYPPFINKVKRIGKEEIEKYGVRTYKPVREYGGWGVRQGIGKAGTAFNVSGKTGLQFVLKTGKKILFGTQRGNALQRAMDKMMNGE